MARRIAALQQPDWPDPARLDAARALLAMPPLVFAGEARALRDALAEVAAGRAFLLQAGDCAESFDDFSAVAIREKLKIMLQMAAVLTYGATLPVVKIGRIAGQFVKPRSSPTERRSATSSCPSFRGHMVNGEAPTPRRARPTRTGCCRATTRPRRRSTSCARSRRAASPTSTQVHMWNQEFVASSPEGRRYEPLASEIERALRFMARAGSTSRDGRSCTRSTSGRATRACCSTTRRR